MTDKLRLAIGQLNLPVGDVAGNVEHIIKAAQAARDDLHAHVVVFPELSITSYPPEDLLLRLHLYDRVEAGLGRVRDTVRGIDVVLGYPRRLGDKVYNAASVLRDGQIIATYHKQLLPNYSVFDERRYFAPGSEPCVVDIQGIPVGLTICEDVWQPEAVSQCVAAGASLVLTLNASPYHMHKGREREQLIQQRVRESGVPMVYVNLVGGQDELVFDGESFVMDARGRVTQRCPAFAAGLYPVEFDGHSREPLPVPLPTESSLEEQVYRALVLGVRDYVEKNRFPGVVVGLSGGVDSALTLCIAVDALGADRVEAVMMPSRYTSSISLEDAAAQAKKLGVHYRNISIEPMHTAFLTTLTGQFQSQDRGRDVSAENIQARIRGTLLMAISNKTGKMVLTTGNKSEMAVGYATLYGDMAGGYAAIKDVFKTLVYQLVGFRNRVTNIGLSSVAAPIPTRVVERAPSAELAPDQKDTDSLPPYEILDPILERYVERDQSPQEIIAAGFDAVTVNRIVTLVDSNEYKRRQAAPGVRITRRAFGRDRRYPITCGYREG